MSNSKFIDVYIPSACYNTRTQKISKITIHHMAGKLTVEQCGNIFRPRSRGGSSNYGIDSTGKVALYVPEYLRAWTSSSAWNDQRAITIEVANNSLSPNWTISDAAYKKLILLCADICKRNGIRSVNFDGTKNAVLTIHCMFAATACPGPYIKKLLENGIIVRDINNVINGGKIDNIIESKESSSELHSIVKTVTTKPMTFDGVDYTPVFDPEYYTNTYSDVKKVFGTNTNALFNHFTTFGMNEKRQANKYFNVQTYRKNYKDLDKAFGDKWPEYYKHYCVFGKNEGRKTI